MDGHWKEPEELQAWLDGELDPARAAEVGRHVEGCAECSALVEDLKRVSASLQTWQVEPAPASLRPPTVVFKEKPPARFRWLSWKPAMALAGTAAVVLLMIGVMAGLRISDIQMERAIESQRATGLSRHPLDPTLKQEESSATEAEPKADEEDQLLGFVGATRKKREATSPPLPPAANSPLRLVAPADTKPEQERDDARQSFALKRSADEPALGAESKEFQRTPPTEKPLLALESEALQKTQSGEQAAEELARKLKQDQFAVANAAPEPAGVLADKTESRVQARSEAAQEGAVAGGVIGGIPSRAVSRLDAVQTKALTEAVARQRAMLAYQAEITVEVADFDNARSQVETLVTDTGGYISESDTRTLANDNRQASMHLRVPSERFDETLDKLRSLGRVTRDHLSSEELTDQLVDLDARLTNSRATEKRLLQVLERRTGKVKEVLEVEREISRTRQNIERMEAQRQNMLLRVAMASVRLTLIEEYKAELESAVPGPLRRLRNALVEGVSGFAGMLLGFVLFLTRWGLHLLFWAFLLRLLWLRFPVLSGAKGSAPSLTLLRLRFVYPSARPQV